MDDRESGHALSDAVLDRELEHALAVDPSPEFVARLRTRISSEPEPSWSPSRWIFGLAGLAAVAVVATAIVVSRPDPDVSSRGASRTTPAEARSGSTPPAASPVVQAHPAPIARAVARRPVPRAPRRATSMPEVIVAAGEAAALRQFIAAVQLGRFDPAKLPERPAATVALQTPNEITIAPIAFEPIVTPMAGQGERQ